MKVVVLAQEVPRPRVVVTCEVSDEPWLPSLVHQLDGRNTYSMSLSPEPRMQMLDVDPTSVVGLMLLKLVVGDGVANTVTHGNHRIERDVSPRDGSETFALSELRRLALINALARIDFLSNEMLWQVEDAVCRRNLERLTGTNLIKIESHDIVDRELSRWEKSGDPQQINLSQRVRGWMSDVSRPTRLAEVTRGARRRIQPDVAHGAGLSAIFAVDDVVKGGRNDDIFRVDPNFTATLGRKNGLFHVEINNVEARNVTGNSREMTSLRVVSFPPGKPDELVPVALVPVRFTGGKAVASFQANLNPSMIHLIEMVGGEYKSVNPRLAMENALRRLTLNRTGDSPNEELEFRKEQKIRVLHAMTGTVDDVASKLHTLEEVTESIALENFLVSTHPEFVTASH